ncbi:hypothetical protein L226DRAFT_614191 [Lentinus tigrinus ALCF2SS1-7]|uniref:F-box domain-containing protein n=1 Tax=Lentinus tigrinus ALCF2SS1-6 TaxID=1328759 RepID=A0A5C2SCG8_9APHY|nr:hypothetical protein L227DRAFT_549953 [Lentinus tigrinus ALCF2SS1-6]RPD73278.1 hypothetical protein L226DRAFT_614191 [Lentinus tigrinus ALCF2SS1-7]
MHPALLIDEVLQLIFDFCADLPKTEPKWTYAQLARCCRAWKDPALDRLWDRLNGVGPLLALVAKQVDEVTSDRSMARIYADRVKRVTHQDGLRNAPAAELLPTVFPRLESLALSFQGCMVPHEWAVSPFLQHVSVNVGFSRDTQEVLDRSNAAARLLHEVNLYAPGLRSLQVRGRMTDLLNAAVASFTQLRSVTIHGNSTLAPETFAAIATLPHLQSLEVHASHVQAEVFTDSLAPGVSCFPVLKELSIRTGGDLVSAILPRLPTGILTKLHLDMDQCVRGPSYMKPVFALLAQKASTSLRDLHIEDRTDLDELDVPSRPEQTPHWYTLDILSPLARMKHLRRFVLRDPDMSDADLETLPKWWPALAHLDLGACDPEVHIPEWKSRLTPVAYSVVAKSFPGLESLSLPALPPTGSGADGQQTMLRSLALGEVPNAPVDAVAMVDTILTMFPDIECLDCPTVEITERFETVVRDRGQARID